MLPVETQWWLTMGGRRPNYPNYAQKTDDEEEEYDDNIRVVLTAPHKDTLLETDDVAFMLVQYEQKEENTIEAEI